MSATAARTLQDVLLNLDGAQRSTDATQRITAPVNLGFGYTLTLSNSWGQNLVEWQLRDQRDRRLLALGRVRRREDEDVPKRFRIREDQDHAEVWQATGMIDYWAVSQAFVALQKLLGDWLDHGPDGRSQG